MYHYLRHIADRLGKMFARRVEEGVPGHVHGRKTSQVKDCLPLFHSGS